MFEDTTSEEAGQGSEAEVYCIVPVDGDTKFEFEAFLLIESLNRMDARVAGSFYIGEYHDLSELEGRSLLAPAFHVDDQPVTQASDQWIRRTYTFSTGKSTRYLKIAFCTGCWGRSKAKIFIDNVSLWRISESPWVGEKILPEAAYQKVGNEVRRSLAVPVPSTMQFHLTVPADSHLSTALGVPQFQEETGRLPVRFKVSARRKYGFPATLTDVTVNPGDDWKEQMIDLSRYSGDEIILSFKVAPVRSGKSSETPAPEKAFWGHPDIRNYHSKSDKRPVIWISMDTLRADHLGCMGYPVYTSPNIDRISTRCLLWVDASSASPWTLPSHASILTGTYP